MKFLADMPISPGTVVFLRELGHDVFRLSERGLQKASDKHVIQLAVEERRIILTMDLDFPHLMAFHKLGLPSVVLFRLEDERPESINLLLKSHLQELRDVLENGAIVVFEENRIRIHSLPI